MKVREKGKNVSRKLSPGANAMSAGFPIIRQSATLRKELYCGSKFVCRASATRTPLSASFCGCCSANKLLAVEGHNHYTRGHVGLHVRATVFDQLVFYAVLLRLRESENSNCPCVSAVLCSLLSNIKIKSKVAVQ